MNDLLKWTIAAHGGRETRAVFTRMTSTLLVGGTVWSARGQEEVVRNLNVAVNTKEQWASFWPFVREGWHNIYTPEKVSILDGSKILEELTHPKESFKGYTIESPWTTLQLTYFAGYAMWTYFNTPFIFANPDFKVEEIEPWEENGEIYRRLRIVFPDNVASHSKVQVLYIAHSGLIYRHDYDVDIIGGAPSVNYVEDYVTVQGLKVGTKRRVYIRKEDNTPKLPEPLLVAIDVSNIVFE